MTSSNEAIVLVHGLWVNGLDMSLLKYRLQKKQHSVYQFSYHSVLHSPAENAEKLAEFVTGLEHTAIHFICHSLGGIVIRHYFAQQAGIKPGRVVTLGTPHQHSSAATQLSRFPPGSFLLGKSVEDGLTGDIPAWDGEHELGSIAGIMRLGLGLFVPGIPKPSDGTVSVDETRLENMADHIEVNASHFGMLMSETVVNQCEYFIQYGRFNHDIQEQP